VNLGLSNAPRPLHEGGPAEPDPEETGMSELEIRPWDELEQAVEAADGPQVQALLEAVPSGEVGRVMARLDRETQSQALALMEPDAAAEVVEQLEDLFDEHRFLGVPVVDRHRRLVGLVRRVEIGEALAERADSDYRKSQGIVGGEELRSMPLLVRAGRRLSWLSVNVVLNVMAASIIVLYEDTLASVIALAAFLPIISDMSGCSGNQAVAVSMRELALGLAQPRDALRVWIKEIGVGAINGVALGVLLGAVAWIWKGNVFLGLVVGGALATNTVVAVSIGGTVPLVLRRLGFDPALASGPILTTVTDICGFFFALGFATLMLGRIMA
jgi:magnesium transporter